MSFNFLFIALFVFIAIDVSAQRRPPFRWEFGIEEKESNTVRVQLIVVLDEGWHIYSQHLDEGGPLPTIITFKDNTDVQWLGDVIEEGSKTIVYDSTFLMDVTWYSGYVSFYREGKVKAQTRQIEGSVEFMICNSQLCLPPDKITFILPVGTKH